MMNKKEIETAFNLAVKYLAYKPRSIHEIQAYLEKKGVNHNILMETIHRLKDHKYLDDHHYAALFIESRVRNKPKSKFAFKYELKQKGISSSIINEIIESLDDQTLAIKSVKPKIRLWKNFDDEKFKKKIINFLQYRGFNYDICLSTLHYFKEDKKRFV